jgi:hypothetical protein
MESCVISVYLIGVNAYLFSIFIKSFKCDYSIDLGEKGIILSQTYIFAGVYYGAFLPDQYASGMHLLTGVSFYAVSLADTIPSISSAAARFFM